MRVDGFLIVLLWLLVAVTLPTSAAAQDLPDIMFESMLTREVVVEQQDGSSLTGVLVGYDGRYAILEQATGTVTSIKRTLIVHLMTKQEGSEPTPSNSDDAVQDVSPDEKEGTEGGTSTPSSEDAGNESLLTTSDAGPVPPVGDGVETTVDSPPVKRQLGFRSDIGGYVSLTGLGAASAGTVAVFEYRNPLGHDLHMVTSVDWFSTLRQAVNGVTYFKFENLLQWRKILVQPQGSSIHKRISTVFGVGLSYAFFRDSFLATIDGDLYDVIIKLDEFSLCGRFGIEIEPNKGVFSSGIYLRPSFDLVLGTMYPETFLSFAAQYAFIIRL